MTSSFLKSEVKGKRGGKPEPLDWLRFVFIFVSCVACVQAGDAKLRERARCKCSSSRQPWWWEVLLLFLASWRSPGREVRVGFKAGCVHICSAKRSSCVRCGFFDESS